MNVVKSCMWVTVTLECAAGWVDRVDVSLYTCYSLSHIICTVILHLYSILPPTLTSLSIPAHMRCAVINVRRAKFEERCRSTVRLHDGYARILQI